MMGQTARDMTLTFFITAAKGRMLCWQFSKLFCTMKHKEKIRMHTLRGGWGVGQTQLARNVRPHPASG